MSALGVLGHNNGCNIPISGLEISRTIRKVGEKIDYIFKNKNDALNWASGQLGPGKFRIYDESGKWIGWQNSIGDKVYWGHGDWYTDPDKSKFPHINFKFGSDSGHLFLADKIRNTSLWNEFSGFFGM